MAFGFEGPETVAELVGDVAVLTEVGTATSLTTPSMSCLDIVQVHVGGTTAHAHKLGSGPRPRPSTLVQKLVFSLQNKDTRAVG